MEKKLSDSKKVLLIIILGWVCLAMSSLCFYISTRNLDTSSEVSYALWLFTARLFGITAFGVGGFSLFNKRWTNGTLLLFGSVVLPFVSLLIHGTI